MPVIKSLPFPGCLQGARLFICIFPIVCNSHNIRKEGRYNYPYLQMNKLRQVKKLAYLPICLLVPFTDLSGSSYSLARLVITPIFQRMKQRRRLQNLFLYFWDSRRVLRFDRFAPSAGGCGHACVTVSPAPPPPAPCPPPQAPETPERSDRSSEDRGWEKPTSPVAGTQPPGGLGSRGVGSEASPGTAERWRRFDCQRFPRRE